MYKTLPQQIDDKNESKINNSHPTTERKKDESEYAGQRIIPVLGRPSYFLEDDDNKCGFLSDPSLSEDGGDTSSQASPFPNIRRNILPISPTSAEVSSLGNNSLSSKDSEQLGSSKLAKTTATVNPTDEISPNMLPFRPRLVDTTSSSSRYHLEHNNTEGSTKLLQPNNPSESFDLRPLPSLLGPSSTQQQEDLDKVLKNSQQMDESKNTMANSQNSPSPVKMEQFGTPDSIISSTNSKLSPNFMSPKETLSSPEENTKKLLYKNNTQESEYNTIDESLYNKFASTNDRTLVNPSSTGSEMPPSTEVKNLLKGDHPHITLPHIEEKLERKSKNDHHTKYTNSGSMINTIAKGKKHSSNQHGTNIDDKYNILPKYEHVRGDADDEEEEIGRRSFRGHRRRLSSSEYGGTKTTHRRIRSGDDVAASLMGNLDWHGMEVMQIPHPREQLPEQHDKNLHMFPKSREKESITVEANNLNMKNKNKRDSTQEQHHVELSDTSQDEYIRTHWRKEKNSQTQYMTDSSISSLEFLAEKAARAAINASEKRQKMNKGSEKKSDSPKKHKRASSRESIDVRSTSSRGSSSSHFSWISNGLSFFSGVASANGQDQEGIDSKRLNKHKRSDPSSFKYLNQSFTSIHSKEKNDQPQPGTGVAPNLLQRIISPRTSHKVSPVDDSSYVFGQRENLNKKELEHKRMKAFENHLKSLSAIKHVPRQCYEISEEDAKKFATYICPRCNTRQREFFTVATATRNFENPLGFLFVYFTIYVCASLFIFGLEEGWPALDCIYFSVITFTSTGFGDYVPTTDGAKIICSIFIYFGVACIGLLLGSLLANSQDEASRKQAKENLVNNCVNCQRADSIPKKQFFHSTHIKKSSIRPNMNSQNFHSGQFRVDKKKTPRKTNKSSAEESNIKLAETDEFQNDQIVEEVDEQYGNKLEPQNSTDEKHPLLDMSVGNKNKCYSSYSPQSIEAKFHTRTSSTSSIGLPDPSYAFNKRNHTRHLSLSHDFNMKMIGRRKMSSDLPKIQSPSINEHEPLTDDISSVPGSYEDYADYDDSDSFTSFEDSDFQQANDLKTAKYVFQTLHEALANSIFIILIGSFGFYIIEGMSAVNSFYFTTVLLTTVGYGDITPQTNEGKLFATVYVLIAGTVLLHNMSLISMIPLEMRKRRIETAVLSQFGESVDDATLMELATGPLVKRLQLAAYRADGLHECTREMFALAMLVRLGKVTERDVRSTYAAFNRLDLDKDGKLSSKEIILSTVQRQRSMHQERIRNETISEDNDGQNYDEFSDCNTWSDQNAVSGSQIPSEYSSSLTYSGSLSSPQRRSIFPREVNARQQPSSLIQNPSFLPHKDATIDEDTNNNNTNTATQGYNTMETRNYSGEHHPIHIDPSDIEAGKYTREFGRWD